MLGIRIFVSNMSDDKKLGVIIFKEELQCIIAILSSTIADILANLLESG